MKDNPRRNSETDRYTSSTTASAREPQSHTLTLAPGDQLIGLGIFQIDQPHQHTLVQIAETTAQNVGPADHIRGCAIFRSIDTGDVAVLTQWGDPSAHDQVPPTLLKPIEQDLYHLALLHHAAGRTTSRLSADDGLFSEPLRRRIIRGFPRFRFYELAAARLYESVQTGAADEGSSQLRWPEGLGEGCHAAAAARDGPELEIKVR